MALAKVAKCHSSGMISPYSSPEHSAVIWSQEDRRSDMNITSPAMALNFYHAFDQAHDPLSLFSTFTQMLSNFGPR
jgi:hypothetical protein